MTAHQVVAVQLVDGTRIALEEWLPDSGARSGYAHVDRITITTAPGGLAQPGRALLHLRRGGCCLSYRPVAVVAYVTPAGELVPLMPETFPELGATARAITADDSPEVVHG